MATVTHSPVLVTPGDPAGIGGEIALRAKSTGCNNFCLIENVARMTALARKMDLDVQVQKILHPAEFCHNSDALQILDITWPVTPVAGRPDFGNAQSVITAIETGARWAQNGTIAALVTNPIAKATLYDAGFDYPGHTEFLGSMAPACTGGPAMMLISDMLRVVPVTVHIPLLAVANSLTTELIVNKGRLVAHALRKHFNIFSPRLAVCGLNPHAGEMGRMGSEDAAIITPAINQLCAQGIDAKGPYSADTLFHEDARKTYDVVLGMYHDQVLIPLKTLDFFGGVNITLGLDFIRTSPDHGTGFDIAEKGVARPDSLIAAIKTAHAMAGHLSSNDDGTAK